MMEPFATPEQVAAYTRGKITASTPGLDDLLGGASAAIRRHCGWHIGPVAREALVVDGSGGQLLALPTGHLVEVHEVTEHGQPPVPGDDIEWSALGTLRKPGRWTSRYRGVRADIEHGYPIADLPDLTQVVCQIVSTALASPTGATREQAGALAVSWATTAPNVSGGITLLERDLALLAPYMLGVRA